MSSIQEKKCDTDDFILPTFIRKDELFKFELNRIGVQKFILDRKKYQQSLSDSLLRLKRRLPSDNNLLQSYISDWEHLLHGTDDRLKEVILGSSDYSTDMRQNSPFSSIITEDERQKVLKEVYPDVV